MKKYDLIFLTDVAEEYTKRQAVYFFSNGYGNKYYWNRWGILLIYKE